MNSAERIRRRQAGERPRQAAYYGVRQSGLSGMGVNGSPAPIVLAHRENRLYLISFLIIPLYLCLLICLFVCLAYEYWGREREHMNTGDFCIVCVCKCMCMYVCECTCSMCVRVYICWQALRQRRQYTFPYFFESIGIWRKDFNKIEL